MQLFSSFRDVSKEKWSDFVINHINGNIFQTPEFYEVIASTSKYEPIMVCAVENGIVLGLIVGTIQREHQGFLGYFSSRCIVWGAPLVKDNDEEIAKALFMSFVGLARKRSIYIQFRCIFNTEEFNNAFSEIGFTYEPHLDILINLNQSFDRLGQEIKKSRIRNYTKAINKGVIVREATDLSEIQKGYDLLISTYRRVGLPLPDLDFFEALFEVMRPKSYVRFWLATFENEIVGFRVVLTFGSMIYDFYAGASDNHSNKYPNDVLLLEIFKQGCSSDFLVFDFGGAGKPGVSYPVRDYKLQFGGQLIEFGRFTRINNRYFYLGGKFLLKLYKYLKGK